MTRIANIEEIPLGEGRAYVIDGEEVAVFRLHDGSVRALGAVCPHRGGPLADGLTDKEVVVCPLHGFTYDLITGAETANGGVAVCAYVATVDAGGTVHVGRHSLSETPETEHKHTRT